MSSCLQVSVVSGEGWGSVRGTDATACDDKVIVLGHSPRSLYYLVFVIGYDFDTLHLHAEREAEFRHKGRVSVDGLEILVREATWSVLCRMYLASQHFIADDQACCRVYLTLLLLLLLSYW